MWRGLGRGFFLVSVEVDHLRQDPGNSRAFWSKVPPLGLVKCVFERAIMHSSSEGLPSDHQLNIPQSEVDRFRSHALLRISKS